MKIDKILAMLLAAAVLVSGAVGCGGQSLAKADNKTKPTEPEPFETEFYVQFEINKYADRVEIVELFNEASQLVIPDFIAGLPVTKLCDEAFKGHKELRSVTIPETVSEIGAEAFSGCKGLTKITVPSSVKRMGKDVFAGCSHKLTVSVLADHALYEEGALGAADQGIELLVKPNSTALEYAKANGISYRFTGVKGDVNHDGVVDAIDASCVLAEYSATVTKGGGTFDEETKELADVNNDGRVDSLDASLIFAYYSQSSSGGVPTWD